MRLGYNGLRHMEKVGHKVCNRPVFVNNKLVSKHLAASIYICHLLTGLELQIQSKKQDFFPPCFFPLPHFGFGFFKGFFLDVLYFRASAAPLIHPAEERT